MFQLRSMSAERTDLGFSVVGSRRGQSKQPDADTHFIKYSQNVKNICNILVAHMRRCACPSVASNQPEIMDVALLFSSKLKKCRECLCEIVSYVNKQPQQSPITTVKILFVCVCRGVGGVFAYSH